MSALTDSQNWVSYDPENRPGVANLIDIMVALGDEAGDAAALAESFKGLSLRDLKVKVADTVISHLAGFRGRYLELIGADGGRYIDSIEAAGAALARANAEETMQRVREATGL